MIMPIGPPELLEGGGLFTIVANFYSPPFKLNSKLERYKSYFVSSTPPCEKSFTALTTSFTFS